LSTPFGPTGQVVFDRTYSRTKEDGTKETWHDTVDRVVTGNLSLVYGDKSTWSKEVWHEAGRLEHYMDNFAIIPAGRQLWASGVEGRQFLFNCHVSGWGEKFSDHFDFTFMRLMEGGGVGANYSMKYIGKYGAPKREIELHIVCDKSHPDYDELLPYLSPDLKTGIIWDYSDVSPKIQYFSSPIHNELVVEDSREGWAKALTWLLDISMSDQYDYGYDPVVLKIDVGGIRASGQPLRSFGGTASGPAPFAKMMLDTVQIMNRANENGVISPIDAMEIDHAVSECVVSGGVRRSARMSIVAWDDPYIMDFLRCKIDTGLHWTTNISVEIDSNFINNLELEPDLKKCQDMRAWIVHQTVCEAMLKNGEPGYWNKDLANVGEVSEVMATNPCGEIPLESWEACNLGHVNLDYFIDPEIALGYDYHKLAEAHRLMARFLVRSTFGDISDPRQRVIQDKNRRIGVGHLGVQGFWAKQGIKYSEVPYYDLGGILSSKGLLRRLKQEVRMAAHDYAFELRIPEPVKVTTVAPTGSIAKLPGVTEGIHPVYSRWYERRIRFSKRSDKEFGQVMDYMAQGFKVEDDVYDKSGMTSVVVFPTEDILVAQVRAMGIDPAVVESADEISLEDMLAFQAMYQEHYADNAVAFTVNVPDGSLTVARLSDTLKSYLPRLKGTTLMVDASREQAPYTRITEQEYAVAAAKLVEDSTDESCASGACPVKLFDKSGQLC
jgi:ribonucleoside-triphosphate reductase (thioredoxin)